MVKYLLLASLILGFPFRQPAPEELPVLGEVPDFRLVDHRGEPFRVADLSGRVWIANFIFTRCRDVCPRMTEAMRVLLERTAKVPDLQFVSFSVDPTYDTPERLHAYARRQRAQAGNWSFVTGRTEDVLRSVTRSFKVYAGDPVRSADGAVDIGHGRSFVLVDRKRRIRGYYSPDDRLRDLERDARLLAATSSRRASPLRRR